MTPAKQRAQHDPGIAQSGDDTEIHSRKFRFKRKRPNSEDDHNDRSSRTQHRSHRSKRMKPATLNDDPSLYDDSASQLPPDVAFRESLFDALGDDEGAAFWQGVYGQPIHTYPDTAVNDESGELEKMTDDEYASFVRRKMWEKSWEGIEAAREEKRKAVESARQRKNEGRARIPTGVKGQDTGFVFEFEVENSLRRGAERREKKKWKSIWENYIHRWDDLQALHDAWRKDHVTSEQLFLRNKIAWPVESGKRTDVSAEAVEHFMRKCSDSSDESCEEVNLLHILKAERVRFHPDKIQQRYGFMGIDQGTMQGVTAVFQALDRMRNELRDQ